jgi:hypothetical protein
MSTMLRGRLGAEDHADVYTVWRRPGRCAYELVVRGGGAARLVVEVAEVPAGAGWRVIEDGAPVTTGSRRRGAFDVPGTELAPGSTAPWVQARLRVVRLDPPIAAEYELTLDPPG